MGFGEVARDPLFQVFGFAYIDEFIVLVVVAVHPGVFGKIGQLMDKRNFSHFSGLGGNFSRKIRNREGISEEKRQSGRAWSMQQSVHEKSRKGDKCFPILHI
jgi:hypothetical protein